MSLLTIPNVSTGPEREKLGRLEEAVRTGGGRLLDCHSDPVHERTVLTIYGEPEELVQSAVALAETARDMLDLTGHRGVHPRVGVLDVCPFVPLEDRDLPEAVGAALAAAQEIGDQAGLPVFLYGAAAGDQGTRELPEIRRGGLEALVAGRTPPDFGPREIDPKRGVVCVGARLPLIAFNVWISAGTEVARAAAASVREADGGLPGVRALGLRIDEATSQVSMNLTDPRTTGIDRAFEAVAKQVGLERIQRTEIVGLPPARYMPDPDAPAARLMIPPGRSLESLIR